MTTMLEAMIHSGLVQGSRANDEMRQFERRYAKGIKKQQHKSWKERCHKNRYGDVALFEVWGRTQTPQGDPTSCALCGRKGFKPIAWDAPNKRHYNICRVCYLYEAAKSVDRI